MGTAQTDLRRPTKSPTTAGVNSPAIELCPMVTADGKYLFFLSQRDGESHVYWVSAAVIEKLRPAGAKK